jgi:hypothetical protein
MPLGTPRGSREYVVTATLVAGLLGYAAYAVVIHRWVSAVAAPLVAALLAFRHPRARFSAYVLFSAAALHGLVLRAWPLVACAVAGVLLLQTAPARRAWPRLRPGATRASRST